MSKEIIFSLQAFDDYTYWQKEDKKTLKKINELIKDIQRNGNVGIGKPEPLKFDKQGYWSRRINNKDRLVYYVDDNNIKIVQCKGHYDDK